MSLENQIFSLRSAIIKAKRQVKEDQIQSFNARQYIQSLPSKQVECHTINKIEKVNSKLRLNELRRHLEKDKKFNRNHQTEMDEIRYFVSRENLPRFSEDLHESIKQWKMQRRHYTDKNYSK